MKPVTIILTSVGCVISPSQIDSLKNNPDGRKVRIIGVDMNDDSIGKYMVDKFYKVPAGDDIKYITRILEICKKEKVSVVMPISNEEAEALSRNKKRFKQKGIAITVSDYPVFKKALDKAEAYTFLREMRLPCPTFYVVNSFEDFMGAAWLLGYPKKDIVIKPALGRGGRGTRILTGKKTEDHLLKEKPGSLRANFNEVANVLSELKKFPKMIVMEYLPGTFCSVDLLAKKGKALAIVPKVRIVGTASQTIVGQVRKNKILEGNIRKICKAFGFDYTINIETKQNERGEFIPYDINPRIAASVAFCTAAGANILYYALKMALGEKIPKNIKIKDKVKMIRYWKEFYVTKK